jgi:two-component system chemotaxis response regulator CheY
MFTKPEINVVIKTLQHRRDWIAKNLDNPEQQALKEQNQQTLSIIDHVIAKLTVLTPIESAHSHVPVKPPKLIGLQRRNHLEPAQIKVLIVDDDELISSFLGALLYSIGIRQIDSAQDGLKAISMLYDANPVYDLVLCDWHMPIKNGLDVHNAMRAAERYMDTCFMLVTAVTEAKQIREAIDEGVDDYVVKPIEEQKIIKKIARHFPKIIAPEENSPE